MTKKVLCVFSCIAMMAVILLCNAKSVNAASQDYVETNGTSLVLNQATNGSLTTASEEIWYKFSVTEKGYFQIEFAVSASTDVDDIDNGWDIKIYRKGNLTNPVKSYSGVKTYMISACLPMGIGDYYVCVDANDSYSDSYAPTGCYYDIRAKFTPSTYWEQEDNDNNTGVNLINVNTDYYGTLYYSKDVDWYKFITTSAGYYQLQFAMDSVVDVDEIDDGWNVTIYDSSFNEIKNYSDICSNYTAPKLPFAAGTFYVKIKAENSYSDSYAPTDCIYHLKMAFTSSLLWETEYNDSRNVADTITVNKTYYGLLYKAKDVDWYKVTTTENGYFRIKFYLSSSVNVDNIDEGWCIKVYDSNNNLIKQYNDIKQNVTEQVLPFAKGTYYVVVQAQNNYGDYYAPTDCEYGLQVAQTKSSVWESEYNNTKATADNTILNTSYNGLLMNSKDVDWYKINLLAAGTVKINLKKDSSTDFDDIHKGWDVYLYNTSSATAISKITVTNSSTITKKLAKGTYYIKVCANDNYSDSYAPTDCIYNLKVSYAKTPAASRITRLTAGLKKITLTWSKSSSATGYYIYRSTSKNGTYTKIATVSGASKVSYTNTKLTSKRRYYYKVVAYTTANGVTTTASASSVMSAVVK